MKLAVITCTGDRPESFALCEKWVNAQTYKDFLWICIDDGTTPIYPGFKGEHLIYLKEKPEPGTNTLARNFKLGLKMAEANKADFICVFEDDDFYAPEYLETIIDHSTGYSLIGVRDITYYHTSKKYYELKNGTYSPLAFTSFSVDLLPLVRQAIDNHEPYKTFDMKFWRMAEASGLYTKMLETDLPICVGVKGMPGRAGIGKGHRDTTAWKYDSTLVVAEELFRNNLEDYLTHFGD